jgi:hypothetical protein
VVPTGTLCSAGWRRVHDCCHVRGISGQSRRRLQVVTEKSERSWVLLPNITPSGLARQERCLCGRRYCAKDNVFWQDFEDSGYGSKCAGNFEKSID